MKKLVSAFVATAAFAIASPVVFACPGMDHDKAAEKTGDTKTAEKAPAKKADDKATVAAPAKPKAAAKPTTTTAKAT
jgi:hypothetical protein